MLVQCVYRLAPYGELIWDRYNTETGRVMKVPADVIQIELPTDWHQRNYTEAEQTPTPRYAEWYMQHDHECFMCIEWDCLGFLAIDWHGNVNEVFHLYTKRVFVYSIEPPKIMDDVQQMIGRKFYTLGWRKTSVLQYSHKPYIWELLADENGNVFTSNGTFHFDEPISTFDSQEKITPYEGYVQCAKEDNFGVVFRMGHPLQVIANADRLTIAERR